MDKAWYQTQDRSATYTNLDPGSYTFMVKATNADGIWSDTPTTLSFEILPPFWKTWWAYSFYMIAFIGLIYGLIRAFIIRERLKANLKLEKLETQKIQEINTMRTRFFTNISHEFRTPLTLISGPVNDLLKDAKNLKLKEGLGIVLRNTQRLKRLIDQLLDLSKLEVSTLRLNNKEQDLTELLRVATISFHSLAEKNEIQYKTHLPSEPLWVNIDGEKLEMILYNLLSNALKFTPEKGRVEVNVKLEKKAFKDLLRFEVTDTGPGLEEHEKERIFDRFYRAEQDGHTEGTGIGLALSRELAELMGGTIEVAGEKNKGSTFALMLPLEQVEAPLAKATDKVLRSVSSTSVTKNAKSNASLKRQKLLIVEDNPDMRLYLRRILENEVHLLEAKNGEEGLIMALREVPDIVITDLMMPKMGGDELCRQLKQDERTSHIPVIMLTAKASAEDKVMGLELGADDYLTKPFNKEEVRLKVRNILRRREQFQKVLRKTLAVAPDSQSTGSRENQFLAKLKTIVLDRLGQPNFDVANLSDTMGLSRSQLYRKVQALTGLTPSALIREIRIHKAATLLKARWDSISQIAYAVGFNNLSHFAQSFKEVYRTTPSQYLKEHSDSAK